MSHRAVVHGLRRTLHISVQPLGFPHGHGEFLCFSSPLSPASLFCWKRHCSISTKAEAPNLQRQHKRSLMMVRSRKTANCSQTFIEMLGERDISNPTSISEQDCSHAVSHDLVLLDPKALGIRGAPVLGVCPRASPPCPSLCPS